MVLQQSADKANREHKKNGGVAPQPVPTKAAPASVQTPATQKKTSPVVAPKPVEPKAAPVTTVSVKETAPTQQEATPKVKQTSAPKPRRDDSKALPALQIVAEESGLALEDLTDDSNFADAGVDSLLSMVIGSRFREELGLDLEADFSIFTDLPTVKQIKQFF